MELNEEELIDTAEASAPVGSRLAYLTAELRACKRTLDSIESERKTVQSRYDEIRKRELPDALAEAGLTSFKTQDGASVHLRVEMYPSVDKATQPAFFQWLRDHGHGGIIVPQVHPQTFRAWYKEQRENARNLPDYIKVYEEPVAVLRGGKE